MTENEYILTHILNCSRTDLYAGNFDKTENFAAELSRILERRKRGEPLQYITGSVEFMGLNFRVDKRALIPRPETEILTEEAIKISQNLKVESQNILDMGTGCGNIAISLARYLPECSITAVDISPAAIELAKENAALNQASGKIEFTVSDLFSDVGSKQQFDIMVSNPPYISAQDMQELPPEVKCEPGLALDGGGDGLNFYRRIIRDSPAYLKKGGMILLEIGYNQSSALREIMHQSEYFKFLQVIRDYSNIERVIVLEKG